MQGRIPSGDNGRAPDFERLAAAGDKQAYPAWEEVESGRFMPRRVRGSCQGRALG